MNDNELATALRGLYEAKDEISAERAEKSVDDKAAEYEPKLRRERYEIGPRVDVSVDYKDRHIDITNDAGAVRIPFDAIPSLIRFLGWLGDFRKIWEE